MKTTEIYADTRKTATCNGPSCSARIIFAQVVKSGKKMPFDPPLIALSTRHDEAHRLIESVDLDANHFATCPDRKKF